MEWRAGGDRGRLTLLLQLGLPCLQDASEKAGADVVEEPLNCFPGPLVLVEHRAGHLAPRWGIWS